MLKSKVTIVGAGASGISAACKLVENGIKDFVILEAADRIGGRIHSAEFADGIVDLGAQWVHGEKGNISYQLASPHGLLSDSKMFNHQGSMFADMKGNIIPKEECNRVYLMYRNIVERSEEDCKNYNGSYGQYFVEQFKKDYESDPTLDPSRMEHFLDFVEKFDNSIQCCDSWYEVSPKGLTDYLECEGNPVLNWKDKGYKTVLDLLTKKFPDPSKELPVLEKVQFGKRVVKLNYSDGKKVILETEDGSKYESPHVIFTASLGVLQEKHSTLFVPALPESKQRAIKGLTIGTADKFFLEFPHRWWPENCYGFSTLWSANDKAEFIEKHGKDHKWITEFFEFFEVDYQPRILCGWITGEYARLAETLPDSEVLEGCLLVLETFFGKKFNIPRPDRLLRSKWYVNPNTRGSYTFQSMLGERMQVKPGDLATPILGENDSPLLLFAGEATHDYFYSTVHGAIETGVREATRISEYYSDRQLDSHL